MGEGGGDGGVDKSQKGGVAPGAPGADWGGDPGFEGQFGGDPRRAACRGRKGEKGEFFRIKKGARGGAKKVC